MAFNKDSTLLVFGSEANGTIESFERDYKLTSLTPLSWPNGPGQIKSPSAISSFVFLF
jgi:hypothetical protein